MRNLKINILEVVDSRPANNNGFRGHLLKAAAASFRFQGKCRKCWLSEGFRRATESFYYKTVSLAKLSGEDSTPKMEGWI